MNYSVVAIIRVGFNDLSWLISQIHRIDRWFCSKPQNAKINYLVLYIIIIFLEASKYVSVKKMPI